MPETRQACLLSSLPKGHLSAAYFILCLLLMALAPEGDCEPPSLPPCPPSSVWVGSVDIPWKVAFATGHDAVSIGPRARKSWSTPSARTYYLIHETRPLRSVASRNYSTALGHHANSIYPLDRTLSVSPWRDVWRVVSIIYSLKRSFWRTPRDCDICIGYNIESFLVIPRISFCLFFIYIIKRYNTMHYGIVCPTASCKKFYRHVKS